MEFSIKDFFSICDQICSFPRIWSHLLKKSFMENFILNILSLNMLLCKLKYIWPNRLQSPYNKK